MCGRYSLSTPPELLMEELGLSAVAPGFAPHFNIAPTQQVAVVPNREPRRLHLARWGLVPWFAKDLKEGARRINARAETAGQKAGFKEALERKRCLVVADGFYEWRQEEGAKKKTPFYFQVEGGRPFAFAGLWDVWRDAAGEKVASCTILTKAADEQMASVHDRMPVFVPRERYADWLAPEPLPPAASAELLAGLTAGAPRLTRREVSPLVNSAANDLAACVEPVGGTADTR